MAEPDGRARKPQTLRQTLVAVSDAAPRSKPRAPDRHINELDG